METKKNNHLDPSRNQNLYFSMGVAVAAIMAYAFLELQSYKSLITDDSALVIPVTMVESQVVLPPIKIEQPKPKPIPQDPIYTPVPDDSPDPDPVTDDQAPVPLTNPTDVFPSHTIAYVAPPVEIESVPFVLIEDVPIFPGCEKVSKDQRRQCFQDKLHAFIKKNLRYPEAAANRGIEGRVNVSFVIDQDGVVTVDGARGPDKALEAEAKRIIEKLPKMTPGKQRNKPVKMPMALPIVFKL